MIEVTYEELIQLWCEELMREIEIYLTIVDLLEGKVSYRGN